MRAHSAQSPLPGELGTPWDARENVSKGP